MSEIFTLLPSALGSAERSKLGQKIPPAKGIELSAKKEEGLY